MPVESVGVAGAGTMGAGIAQLACAAGYRTVLHDPSPEALEAGAEKLRAGLRKFAEKGRLAEADAEAAAARLELAGELRSLRDCDLVIEAAPESLELKRELFAALAEVCRAKAILATNTSSLSVGDIGRDLPGPERVVGMHFFNPPPLMPLVEIVAAEPSAPECVEAVTEVARRMGRTPVTAADVPGFIANRCARPYSLEGLRLVGEGVATVEQVDRIARVGGGYRMGPFELTDLVGIDVNLSVAESFYRQSGHEPRWEPHPIQREMVAAGRLGRKTGRGYYAYSDGPHRPDDPEPGAGFDAGSAPDVGYVAIPEPAGARLVELARTEAIDEAGARSAERWFAARGMPFEWVGDAPGLVLGRILSQLVNEAFFALEAGVASRQDIDTALTLGLNHPRGPFEWLELIGAARIVEILDELQDHSDEARYRVCALLRREAGGM